MKLEPFKYDIISTHAWKARGDRFSKMLTEIGFNGIVRSVVDDLNPAHVQHITDTGILFITGTTPEGEVVVVTGFLLTMKKATAIYKGERLPQPLYNAIAYNMRKHSDLFTNEEKPNKKKK